MLDRPSIDQSYVWVRTQRQSACDSCKLKSGCGQSVLSKLSSDKSMEFEVKNSFDAKQGDVVVIEIPEDGVLTASFIMYLMPLVAMIGSAAAIGSTIDSELFTILAGLIGLGIGFTLARAYSDKHKDDPRFSPRMAGLALTSPKDASCA